VFGVALSGVLAPATDEFRLCLKVLDLSVALRGQALGTGTAFGFHPLRLGLAWDSIFWTSALVRASTAAPGHACSGEHFVQIS